MNIKPNLILLLLSFLTTSVFGSGFQLFENDASGVSRLGAGAGVCFDEPSITFNNSAGLAFFEDQKIQIASSIIHTSMNFIGDSKVFNGEVIRYNKSAINTDGGGLNVVPAIYYANKINNKIGFGIGLNVPFGLSTDWGKDSGLQYNATHSSIQGINIGPAVGYKLNEHLAVGIGIDLQVLMAKLDSCVLIPIGTVSSNEIKISGNSLSLGANVGIIFNDGKNSLGLNYRSRVRHNVQGKSTIDLPLPDSIMTTKITLPDTFSVSMGRQVNNKLKILLSFYYTTWKLVDEVVLKNVVTPSGNKDIKFEQNYNDTVRLSVGFEYTINPKITITNGLVYDKNPTVDMYREVRLPDADRIAMSFGVKYQFNNKIELHAGYARIFTKESNVDISKQITTDMLVTAKGKSVNSANLLTMQIIYKL